ncbi:MAG: hypothetical protein PSV13_03960 [Lacunisphaera sp.]|nr:hypothetical protein [Lacunisphaera sp.]
MTPELSREDFERLDAQLSQPPGPELISFMRADWQRAHELKVSIRKLESELKYAEHMDYQADAARISGFIAEDRAALEKLRVTAPGPDK